MEKLDGLLEECADNLQTETLVSDPNNSLIEKCMNDLKTNLDTNNSENVGKMFASMFTQVTGIIGNSESYEGKQSFPNSENAENDIRQSADVQKFIVNTDDINEQTENPTSEERIKTSISEIFGDIYSGTERTENLTSEETIKALVGEMFGDGGHAELLVYHVFKNAKIIAFLSKTLQENNDLNDASVLAKEFFDLPYGYSLTVPVKIRFGENVTLHV